MCMDVYGCVTLLNADSDLVGLSWDLKFYQVFM